MAMLTEIFRKISFSFRNPFVTNNTPVEQTFQKLGTVGRFLCVFPTKVKIDLGKKNDIPRYHTISTTFSLITIISSVLAITFPLYPFLKELKNKPDSVSLTSPTEHFALRAFLVVFVLSRLFAPIICLFYCKPIGILIQKIVSYDKSFNVINTTPLITTIFCVLFAGSLWDTVIDGIFRYPIMMEAFKKSKFSSLLSTLGVNSPTLSVIHCYSGRIYGEIGVVFLTFCMLYFGRLISQRLKNVRNSIARKEIHEDVEKGKNIEELLQLPTITKERESKHIVESAKLVDFRFTSKELHKLSAKKVKCLVEILKCFEDAFGPFVVLYFCFSFWILVMTFFCLVSYAVHFNGESMDNMLYTKDFIGLLLAIGLTCFRMIAFVECGESISKKGKLLADYIVCMDSTAGDGEVQNLVRHLQHIAAHSDFSFQASGYFKLNRRLIPKVITAVLTFTIVLAQFRSGDV